MQFVPVLSFQRFERPETRFFRRVALLRLLRSSAGEDVPVESGRQCSKKQNDSDLKASVQAFWVENWGNDLAMAG